MNAKVEDYLFQGKAMMEKHCFEDAIMYFSKALEQEQNSEIYESLGNAYAGMKKYNEAVKNYSEALVLEPEKVALYFELGSIFYMQGKVHKAIEYYNLAEEKGFNNIALYLNFAAIYNKLGDKQMELRSYTKAIACNPLHAELYIRKIKLYISIGRFAEAVNTLEDFRKIMPDSLEAYDLGVQIYSGLGNYEKANSIIDDGLRRFPKDFNLKAIKAKLLLHQGQDTKAKEIVTELETIAEVHYQIRDVKLLQISLASECNDTEMIRRLLEEIINIEPDNFCDEQVRFMLLVLCIQTEEYEVVLNMAEALIAQGEKSQFYPTGIYYRAMATRKQGREDKAILLYQDAIKELRRLSIGKTASYDMYLYRALCHKELKEYEEAIELAEFVLKLQPDRVEGDAILAEIYSILGNEEKSRYHLERVSLKNEKAEEL